MVSFLKQGGAGGWRGGGGGRGGGPSVPAPRGGPNLGAPAPTPATPGTVDQDQLMQLVVQMPPEKAKQILGERLYALVKKVCNPTLWNLHPKP